MSQIVRGLFEDLKQRRLLPVAALLLVALVAVPVLMLKKPETSAPATTASTANVSVAGLPDPDTALDQGKPLVSLAVLNQPSNLDSFESKNPFKPMNAIAKSASQASNVSVAAGAGSNSTATAGGGSGSTSGGGDSSGGSTQTPATTTPTTKTPSTTTPDSGTDTPKAQKLTYALDLSFTTPKGKHEYRGVTRLRMFPSESDPLFIYLGVDATGTKAVFLVDSSLTFTGGEGTCSPSKDSCATVSLEPGEIATFQSGQSEKYELQVDQIREVTTASVSKAAKAARLRESRGAQASVGTKRRFAPPVISDLFEGVGR